MLRRPGLAHEPPKGIGSCFEDQPSISSPSLGCLASAILDRPRIFEVSYIFTFLRSPFDLFPDKDKWCHRSDRTTQKEASGVGIAGLAIGGQRFIFRMQEMTPNNTRKGLRQ